MAMDCTFDFFMNDMNKYAAIMRGVYDNSGDLGRAFVRNFKREAEEFSVRWYKHHEHAYDRHDGWIGDAFARSLPEWFSDWYKAAYGQRPHLPVWFYVHPLGMPMGEDVGMLFCASPIEDAIRHAQWMRTQDGLF